MNKLTLNILTLNSVLNALRSVIEVSYFARYKVYNGKKVFLGNELPAKVSKHHLINSKLYSNKKRPLILVTYGGSYGIVFYEGDKFEWETNSEIKVKVNGEGDMIFVKVKNITRKEQNRLKYEKKSNEEYSKEYWKDVARDMDEDFDKMYNF